MHDRQVNLVSSAGVSTGRLVGEYSGTDYTVRVRHGSTISEHKAWNLFEALVKVRNDLELEGFKPAVEGACRDVYPSRMGLDMGGGRRAYRWPLADQPTTVGIFDEVPISQFNRLAYVDEQRESVRKLKGLE
ncbi:hypothetical protein OOK31_09775 [Streptomyces sp. NBC_00249]|uniref:hypothetical protein n=1 Tax=Streptomyces sp. NBC_00249 TaxID=2975690 RepID=UPI002259471D|nr:hypothetical protein [Streptomyces sp. NBC_00249]MCX5194180.1 hypothetical protein [Streptomyces sp. NBC_00249]